MTISSTVRVAGPFIGNGTASVFSFTFKVFSAADLDVIRLATSTGVETTLVLNSDYSVSLNGDQNSNPGGSITMLAGALATGFTLTITSDIANLQPTDLTNQGGFYPEVITDSLDRATIQIQQISDIGDRTLKIPISDGTGINMELPTAAVRANSFLSFDANGEPTVVSAGSSGAPATITRQVFSGTGSQTVFTLASNPGALGNSAQVYIGGVYQQRSTYTIAGTTLTFSAAPVAGTDNIEFVNFLTSNIGSTSADLVTYTPAGSGAVARSAASKFGDVVSVQDFGAVGDGVADDTAAIQAALNTLKEVRGQPGKTYLVRRVAGTRYCIRWQSGMRWVGCGSTIKLADNQYVSSVGCSVIMSDGVDPSPATITTDTFFDGTVDGNSANQGAIVASGNWFTPTIYVNKIARTNWNVRISNGHVLAFYTTGNATNIYDNTLQATVYGSAGGGVSLQGTRWNIPYVSVRDTPYLNNSGAQGNPFVADITDSTIGRIWASNYGYGIKFQGDCSNITVDSIIALQGAGTSSQKDRAVKFQGDGVVGNKNINVGTIMADGFDVNGLYIYNCDNITIGSYIGNLNGQNASLSTSDRADVYIIDSNELTINSLTSSACGVNALLLSGDTNNVNIGTFTCIDTPNAVGLMSIASGSAGNLSNITIGSVSVRNETAGWAAPINGITVGNNNVHIGFVSIDVPFSNYTAAGRLPIAMDASGGRIRTGPIMFRNSPTSGVVQLTNSSTTTAVSTAAVLVATNGIDCAPIIKVEPVSYNGNNNSTQLMAGRFTVSAGNQTTGGLTIRHPPIPSTTAFYARWTIDGYQAPGDCFETTSTTSLKVNANATAAAIADKTNTINLGGKHEGQMVWDTTNNRMMYASGSTDVSPWYVIDGSASVTPA
jgi:hypothetical protein